MGDGVLKIRMRHVWIAFAVVVTLFAAITTMYAANITGARYTATFTATNSGDTINNTSTPYSLSAGSLIAANFIESDALNTAVIRSGNDIAAMPASGRLSMFACMASTTAFTIETTECNAANVNDMTLMRSGPQVGDAYLFGFHTPSRILNLNIGTAGAGTWTITWEYSSDASGTFTALTNVDDKTNGFTNSGLNSVTWDMPNNFALASVNGVGAYWVRARITAFTSATVQALGNQATYETGQWWVFLDSLNRDEQKQFVLYLGGPDMKPNHQMMPGRQGVTTTDASNLELGSSPFVISIAGFFDMSASGGNTSSTQPNFLFKNNTIRLYVTSTGQAGLEIYGDSTTATTSISGLSSQAGYARIINDDVQSVITLEIGDGTTTSTASMATVTFADNANDWVFATNGSMPYFDRLEINFGVVFDYDDTQAQWSAGTLTNTSATSSPGNLALQLSGVTSTGTLIDTLSGDYTTPGRLQSGIRLGQTFQSSTPITVDSIDLLMRGSQHYNTSTFTGDVTVNIYAADGTGAPTGASLGSSTVAASSACPNSTSTATTFSFSPSVDLSASTDYIIELQRTNVAGTCEWAAWETAYPQGQSMSSTDDGVTWTQVANKQYAIPNSIVAAPNGWTVTVGDAGPNPPNDCSNELDDGFGEYRGINTGPDDLTSYCSITSTGKAMYLNLNGLVNPGVNTGHVLRFRVTKSNNTITLTAYLFSNSTATLTASATSTATALHVSDGSLFTNGDQINIDGTTGTEVLTITNVSANQLTVSRGVIGTTAQNFIGTEKVYLKVTSGLTTNVTTIDVWETDEYTLTSGEVAKINDYGDLRAFVYYTNGGSTPAGRISAIEFEVPHIARDFQFAIDGNTQNQYLSSGTRTSASFDLSIIKSYQTSTIGWTLTTPTNTSAAVQVSLDGGTVWYDATNGGEIPGLTVGQDLTGISLLHREFLTSTAELVSPLFDVLNLRVEGYSETGLLYQLTSTPSIVLTDTRDGHDGTFHFASTTASTLTLSTSQLVVVTSTPNLAGQGRTPSIVSTSTEPGNLFSTSTISGIPGADLINGLFSLSGGNIPARGFWISLAIIISVMGGAVVGFAIGKNVWVGAFVTGALILTFSLVPYTGAILPMWTVFPYGFLVGGGILAKERILG